MQEHRLKEKSSTLQDYIINMKNKKLPDFQLVWKNTDKYVQKGSVAPQKCDTNGNNIKLE